jgi:hypothetical protein
MNSSLPQTRRQAADYISDIMAGTEPLQELLLLGISIMTSPLYQQTGSIAPFSHLHVRKTSGILLTNLLNYYCMHPHA